MPDIRVLPDDLVNRIAAGEVVERPASVVKELVENSIDAGSSRILIDVEDGGKRGIRVSDNGIGMDSQDAILSLERHATSKIGGEEDLFDIKSMGFRGEALPAIAAVSRMEITTRKRGEEEGIRIYAEGGSIRRVEACGVPAGTAVTVRNLFFNTPARRNFLKSGKIEMGRLLATFQRMALPFKEIHFELRREGKSVLLFPAGTSLEERGLLVLGRDLYKGCIPLSGKDGEMEVSGFISLPSLNFPSGRDILFFVNRRFIRDRIIYSSLLSAYSGLMERGRFPLAVLLLKVRPDLVDINVHPAKAEVRWRDGRRVAELVRAAVSSALGSGRVITPRLGAPLPPPGEKVPPIPHSVKSPASWPNLRGGGLALKEREGSIPGSIRMEDVGEPLFPEPGFFEEVLILCQFRSAYLLGEWRDFLVIVDQHAAHERIIYERCKKGVERGDLEGERLLFMRVVDVKREDYSILQESLQELAKIGIEIEPFSGRTLAVKSCPPFLKDLDPALMLGEIAEALRGEGAGRPLEERLDIIISKIACISAVRGRVPMERGEAERLMKELSNLDFPFSCPHGRPLIIKVPLSSIERLFKRR